MKLSAVNYASATAPTRERIAGVGSSARDWLASVLERIPACGDVAVRALCHVLIASWIADTMVRERGKSSCLKEVAHHVARSLNASENYNHVDVVKPTLKLLVEILLSSEGLGVESFRRFLTDSLSILRRDDPVLMADPSLMDKRILLHAAGILPKPPAAPVDGMRTLLAKLRLSAPAALVDALTLHLECMTGWGTRPVDSDLITPSLGEVVAGFTVQRLRNNDLVGATRLLRLHEYLAEGRIVARRDDLYGVLCMYHRPQGAFGWYGPEAAMLRKLNSTLPEDTELYLPATLECLWTLAERTLDGWRLFNKVPRYELTMN